MNPDHGSPAQIMVRSVRPNQAFSFDLPKDFLLSSAAGEDSLKVSSLRSVWPVNSTGPGAVSIVNLGGTLTLQGQPKPAAFSGSFALTIAYH